MNDKQITGAEVMITFKNGSSIGLPLSSATVSSDSANHADSEVSWLTDQTVITPEIPSVLEYNVGDAVEVKTWMELKYDAERLDEDGSLILKDGVRFVKNDMAEYCGGHVVITEKRKIHDGTYRYSIEGSHYNWTESMFAEPKADKTIRTQRLLKLLAKEREEVEREIINWQGLLASDMAKLEKIEADIERLSKELNGE